MQSDTPSVFQFPGPLSPEIREKVEAFAKQMFGSFSDHVREMSKEMLTADEIEARVKEAISHG